MWKKKARALILPQKCTGILKWFVLHTLPMALLHTANVCASTHQSGLAEKNIVQEGAGNQYKLYSWLLALPRVAPHSLQTLDQITITTRTSFPPSLLALHVPSIINAFVSYLPSPCPSLSQIMSNTLHHLYIPHHDRSPSNY